MKRFGFRAIIGVPIIVLLSCGGAQKEVKPESVLDTPAGAYTQGMDYLKQGKLDLAQQLFERSRDLARTAKEPFAPAHEGLGLVYLERGDLETAEKEMHEAIDIDGNYATARVGMGRVRHAQGRHDDAIREYDRALKTKTKSGEEQPEAYKSAWLCKGRVLEDQDLMDDAETSYRNALEIDPQFMEASNAWERLQELRRATAGQSDVMKKVAASPAVTRAEISAVLVEMLPLDRIYRHRMAEIASPDDIAESWARGYSEKVLACGILEPYPDGGFHPDETLARAELAAVMQQILVEAFRDPSLETKYIGETKADFTDLSPQSPFYNPVRLMTSRGIMKGRMDGTFGVEESVPGSEALEILRRLKAELE
jgi:tetratricopeptide (TPR) repeat protein